MNSEQRLSEPAEQWTGAATSLLRSAPLLEPADSDGMGWGHIETHPQQVQREQHAEELLDQRILPGTVTYIHDDD